MTRRIVVDSSVAVKWFKPADEAGLADAMKLLDRHGNDTEIIAAPGLLRVEVLNALWSHGYDEATLVQVAADLEGFRLEWSTLDEALSAKAAQLAVRHHITVYDATFAALAKQLDAVLVTADARQAQSKACRTRLIG